MPCPDITTINKTECIGNSLVTINANFNALKEAVCDVEAGVTVFDENTQVGTNIGALNFIGAGVSVGAANNIANIRIPGFESIKVVRLEEQAINAGGNRNNFFILNDGSLRVAGNNQFGELGVGSPRLGDRGVYTPRVAGFSPPIQVDEGIAKIYSQGGCTYAVTTKGRVYACGDNSTNQLGVATAVVNRRLAPSSNSVFRFVNVLGETGIPISKINPTLGYLAAESDPVEELATGTGAQTTNTTVYARTRSGRIFVWGNNVNGIAGIAYARRTPLARIITPTQLPVSGIKRVTSAGGGSSKRQTCWLVTNNDQLLVCGDNRSGQAGIGDDSGPEAILESFNEAVGGPQTLPFGYRVNNVRIGGGAVGSENRFTTWVTLKDGTLWACGWNGTAEVTGTGDNSPSTAISFQRIVGPPSAPVLTDSAFVEDVVAHADGNATTCWALVRDGILSRVGDSITYAYRLVGWGNNTKGQLGNGRVAAREPCISYPGWPWLESGAKVRQVAVAGNGGNKATLVLDTDNNLWAAGFNGNGLLGNGMNEDSNLFRQVLFNPGLGSPVQIRSTNNDSNFANFLVLLSTGKVLGWGYDNAASGQLGVDAQPEITRIPGLAQILI